MRCIEWKPGMRVALGDTIHTVERVTPSGMPVVNGMIWAKDGLKRGKWNDWRLRPRILPVTPEIEARITARRRCIEADILWGRTSEAVEEIAREVRNHRDDPTRLERIVAAVQAILNEEPQP